MAWKLRKRSALECKDPSLAVQSQAVESDINTIVRRFNVTGQLPSAARLPQYGDFDRVDDFRSALEAVMQAQASFDAIPAEIRARFGNSPQAFLEFCSVSENLPQLQEWGLAPKPEGSARSDSPPA